MKTPFATRWTTLAVATCLSISTARAQDLVGEAPVETPPTVDLTLSPNSTPVVSDWELASFVPATSKVYAHLEALYLIRDHTDQVQLSVRTDQQTGVVTGQLDSNSFESHYEPGPRVLFGWKTGEDRSIEVSYYGLHAWRDVLMLGVDAADNLTEQVSSPFLGIVIVQGDQRYEYETEVHNLEINRRRVITDTYDRKVTVLTGFRYFNDQESFSIDNANFVFVDNMGNATNEMGDEFNRVTTYNNVLGVQIGGTIAEYFGPLVLGAHGTAGVYGNFSKVSQGHVLLRDDVLSATQSAGLRESHKAKATGIFTGGLNMGLILARWLTFRAGYEIFLATGLSFAAEQPSQVTVIPNTGPLGFTTQFASPNAHEADGFLFMHGFSFGAELNW